MYRFLFFFITFIILKKELSMLAVIESIIFTTAVFVINTLCIHKITTHSSNKINILPAIKFILILIQDIVVSSWHISNLIILGHLHTICPTIKKVTTKSLTHTKTVILANAITLTPGTMSFYVNKKELYIHALKKSYVTEIQNSKLISNIDKI